MGTNTANRKYINYEIVQSWNKKMGVVGICIHNLKDPRDGRQSAKGKNPFSYISYGGGTLSAVAKLYDPPYQTSTSVYDYIKKNLSSWVEEAIRIRNRH